MHTGRLIYAAQRAGIGEAFVAISYPDSASLSPAPEPSNVPHFPSPTLYLSLPLTFPTKKEIWIQCLVLMEMITALLQQKKTSLRFWSFLHKRSVVCQCPKIKIRSNYAFLTPSMAPIPISWKLFSSSARCTLWFIPEIFWMMSSALPSSFSIWRDPHKIGSSWNSVTQWHLDSCWNACARLSSADSGGLILAAYLKSASTAGFRQS